MNYEPTYTKRYEQRRLLGITDKQTSYGRNDLLGGIATIALFIAMIFLPALLGLN